MLNFGWVLGSVPGRNASKTTKWPTGDRPPWWRVFSYLLMSNGSQVTSLLTFSCSALEWEMSKDLVALRPCASVCKTLGRPLFLLGVKWCVRLRGCVGGPRWALLMVWEWGELRVGDRKTEEHLWRTKAWHRHFCSHALPYSVLAGKSGQTKCTASQAIAHLWHGFTGKNAILGHN